MKVLRKGRPQSGWASEFECTGKGNGGGGCRAKLLVEFSDLYKTYHESYDGSRETYVTFQCPECHIQTDIDYRGPGYSLIPDRRRVS